jgi:hypothetical protein
LRKYFRSGKVVRKDRVKVFDDASEGVDTRKVGGTEGYFRNAIGGRQFGGLWFFENFFVEKVLRISSAKKGMMEVGQEFIKGVRIVADSVPANRKGVGEGPFSVGGVTATIMEILLLIGGLDMNRGAEFAV